VKINTDKIYKQSLNWGIILLAVSITFSITLMNVAFGFLSLAFAIKLFKKDVKFISTGLEIPLGIFLFFYILSALISGNTLNSLKTVINNYWYILHLYVIIYLFGQQELRKFVKILGWSAFAVAVFTVLQSLGGLNFTLHFNINSTIKFAPPILTKFTEICGYPIYIGTGIIGQHMRSAGQILMLFFFTYAAFKKKWPAVILFIALILSFSFSVWFGFLIAFLWYLLVRKKKFITAAVSTLMVLAVLVYIQAPKRTVKDEISNKIKDVKISLKVFTERPLLGIGAGQYNKVSNGNPSSPQSIYMNMLVEGGILTFLAFIYFIYTLCKLYLKRLPSLKERWRELHISAWLALLAILSAGFFNNFLTYAENSVLIWTLAGIIIKIKQSRWTHRLIISKKRS
jgi:hypothetical protein